MATAPDQERPQVRVPFSWISLSVLVVAGVVGALYWLSPTWRQVNESLDGNGKAPAATEEPVGTIPEASVPERTSAEDPAVAVARLKEARAAAMLALLRTWGGVRSASPEKSGRAASRLIRESGLQSARLQVEWSLLERLDYPCLLEWRETSDDFRRVVALVGLSATEASIVDPLVGRRVVSRADLLQYVDGEALIVWKTLPGIKVPLRIRKGKAPAVAALQRSLQKQGLFRGPVTGTYDAATRAAVIRLQSEYGLKTTGVFGVRSYMALSKRALGEKVPSLKARSSPSEKESGMIPLRDENPTAVRPIVSVGPAVVAL